jgi:hypothetical protein
MDQKDEKLKIVTDAGDSVKDALEALQRLVRRAKLRAMAAKRRYERTKTKTDEHNYMLSAQEFYYMAALSSDFGRAANEALAAQIHNTKAKLGTVN